MLLIDIKETTAKIYIDALCNMKSYDPNVVLDGDYLTIKINELAHL
jgi:hypothetical protein